jgi:hypothetical protein
MLPPGRRSLSIADVMFAPFVMRFRTCGIDADPNGAAYVNAICDLAAVREWVDAAKKETWVGDSYDGRFRLPGVGHVFAQPGEGGDR